jgi:hypothetical protein
VAVDFDDRVPDCEAIARGKLFVAKIHRSSRKDGFDMEAVFST